MENEKSGKEVASFRGGGWVDDVKGGGDEGGFGGGSGGSLEGEGWGVGGDRELVVEGYEGGGGVVGGG